MGKVILSLGADPKEVAQRLRKKGFVIWQKADTSVIIQTYDASKKL